MTSILWLDFLLLLLCHHVYGKDPEPTFRTQGSNIELGYCFGADYILVYRSSPEGDQLVGNSSETAAPVTPPADLRGRVHTNIQEFLLGLQIVNLSHTDSATYRKECWQNQTLVTQDTQQLFVCNGEIESEEIIVREDEQWTELLCNSAASGPEGTSVRWYYERYPLYKPTLFLDSSVALEPLEDDNLRNRTKVRDQGFSLALDSELLMTYQQFYCLVMKGKSCLTFQNMYLPVQSENREIYASAGDSVVLHCPADGHDQQWDTPLGFVNGSSVTKTSLALRTGDKDFSLVIPSVSDIHNGHYSCISSSLEMQYSLVLCPKKTPPLPQTAVKGQSIRIECDADQDNHRVQWFHRRSGEHMAGLIHDTSIGAASIPEGLKGRLSLSKVGSSLEISKSEAGDAGVYSCVVLSEPEFMQGLYDSDYDENPAAEDKDYEDNAEWKEPGCVFKQDTVLIVDTRAAQLPPSNRTPYILGAGLVGLVLLVGAIVIGILVKRIVRRRKEATQQNTTVDPSTTQMLSLTQNGD